MYLRYKTSCRVCGNEHLVPVIDLGYQYLQGSFVKENHPMPPIRKIPTQLVRCDVTKNENACGLLQLLHSTPPDILYANYWYRSGTNVTMRDHLRGIVNSAVEIIGEGTKRVLDIGCNDGTLLKCYPDNYSKFGFDPSDIAQEIKAPITVVTTVFPSAVGIEKIGNAKFDVITSIAMFYDLEDPISFSQNIKNVLASNGIWVFEMSYLPLMLLKNSFDTICHEHLEYYSFSVLEYILEKAGLRVFRAEINGINGGSIRCYACHDDFNGYDSHEARDYLRKIRIREFELELDTDSPYQSFQQRIERLKKEMTQLFSEISKRNETIHIYGASTKGNVLLQWYGINNLFIPYASDRNPEKDGSFTLGTNIKIISEEKSRAMNPDYYLVLPWHFKAEFLDREREIIMSGTKMIFPLPEITLVDAESFESQLSRARQEESGVDSIAMNEVLGIE